MTTELSSEPEPRACDRRTRPQLRAARGGTLGMAAALPPEGRRIAGAIRVAVATLVALVGAGIPLIAWAAGSDVQVPSYAGCLNAKHQIVNVAVGSNPSKPCSGSQTPVRLSSGTITSVTAGDGLSVAGSSGDVSGSTVLDGGATLGLQPGYQLPQGCTAAQLAAADGAGGWTCDNDRPFHRIVVVSPVQGGTPADNGNALLQALAAITDASPANPYVLFIEPGIYDLGTQTLVMKPDVDVRGSGVRTTLIRSSTATETVDALLGGTDGAALSSLSIENDAPGGSGIGIWDRCTDLVQVHTTTTAAFGAKIGLVQGLEVVPDPTCSPRLQDIEASADGRLVTAYAVGAGGIDCAGSYHGVTDFDGLTASATGSGQAVALAVYEGTAHVDRSHLSAPPGGVDAAVYAITNGYGNVCGDDAVRVELASSAVTGADGFPDFRGQTTDICTAYDYIDSDMSAIPNFAGSPQPSIGG